MDAGTLRIILIVLGGAVFAAHYYWETRRAARAEDELFEEDAGLEDKREPRLGTWGGSAGGHGDEEDDGDRDVLFRPVGEAADEDSSDGQEAEIPKEAPPRSLILQLSIVAPAGSRFNGPDIVRAAGRCGLEPGEMDIFHRYQGTAADGHLLLSMANLVKPGAFPFGAMADFESPGLSLFTEVAGAPGDPQVLDEILETAKSLAEELGGVVLDDRRHRLTPEAENRLRQRILAQTGARSGLREQA